MYSITACYCTGSSVSTKTNKAVFFTKLHLWHICVHDKPANNVCKHSLSTIHCIPLYVLFHLWKQWWCSIEPWLGWGFACAPPVWREGRCRRLQDQTRVKWTLRCLDNVLFLMCHVRTSHIKPQVWTLFICVKSVFRFCFTDMLEFRDLFAKAKHIAIITGAGVSAESGVPTFRGENEKWRKWLSQVLKPHLCFI